MNNDRNHGILGFLAGAAIGAALGVLFAPRSGKDTREKMANKARETKDDLEDLIDQARTEWARTKGKVEDSATMTKEEVSDFVRFLFDEAADLKDRVGKDVSNSAKDVADHAKRTANDIRHGAN